MKIQHSLFNFLKSTILVILLCLPLAAFTKTINLLEQPQINAKVVATVDLSAGIIPIYTQKDGAWVKVADPNNGNVGWVKSTDLNNAGASQSSFTFTQSIMNDNKSPVTYRVIQFGQPAQTPEQTQAMAKQLQAQQQAIQKSMQKMMRDMDQLFYNDWHSMHHESFPFFVPVMILPVQKAATVSEPKPVNKQKAQAQSTTTSTQQQNTNNTMKK